LGEVPEHWDVRALIRIAVERADYRGATPAKTDKGVFLVTAKNIRRGRIDYDVSKEYVSETEYHTIMRRGLPKLGDLLLTTEAPLGHAALVDREGIALAQRVIRFRFNPKLLEPRFALLSVLSPYFQHQLLRRGTGSTAIGIKASKLPQLRVLCPTLNEQHSILQHIDTECAPLDCALEAANKEISLFREYRTRLICDVVTGKLDVRDAAAKLPDEAAEAKPLDEEEILAEEPEESADELNIQSEEAEV
jgi:type I restriction enzyme S subunit